MENEKDINNTFENQVRAFSSGATRNNDTDRFDYEGFLSPVVLERYAQYMHLHRKQADGKLRASDNWQNLFGSTVKEHTDVCMKSLLRHTMTLWLEHRGTYQKENIEDTLCAIMFNAMAILHARVNTKS